jgi:hypothetical protein
LGRYQVNLGRRLSKEIRKTEVQESRFSIAKIQDGNVRNVAQNDSGNRNQIKRCLVSHSKVSVLYHLIGRNNKGF